MTARLPRVLALVSALAIAAVIQPAIPRATAEAATTITFSVPVQVDPQRFVTEPSVAVSPWGAVFTSGPWGFSTGQSFLWRSQDGSSSYDLEQIGISPVGLRPCSTPAGPGGGDTDQIAFTGVSGQHIVVFADLEALAGVLICVSFDGGSTFFIQDQLATSQQAEGGADRMWLGHDVLGGQDVLYLYSDDLVSGGDAVYRSVDYGANWEVVAQPAFATAQNIGNPGGLVIDQGTHTIYLANTDGNNVVVGAGASVASGPLSFATHVVTTMTAAPFPADLARIALDQSGGVYVAWIEATDDSVETSASADHGATWSVPARVSPPGTTSVLPAITAGSSGRIGVAWYTTTNVAPLGQNSGPWSVDFAQSLNALSSTPSFAVVQVTPHVIHRNPVCVQGLNCTAGSGAPDRNLGDFMSVGVDPSGVAFVVYDDTANQLFDPTLTSSAGAPNVHVARQLTGPSLFAGTGQIASGNGRQAVTTPSSATDPAGDAFWPKQGTIGPNIPRLDLLSAALSTDATGLHAHIGVASTTGMGITTQGGEAWMLQWWWNNALWYAKADASTSGMTCSAGQPQAITSTSGNGKLAIYFGAAPTTCHIDPATNTLVIDVPFASVGAPPTGSVLHEVTAYSFLYDVPGTLMDQVDATPPFTFRVGD
jgi:hypothetical protein